MNKRKMLGMQRDAVNQFLVRFLAMIFSIADERVPHREKLCPDLVLQARHQLNPDERGIGKCTFNGVAQFSAGRLGISRRPQLLIHAFTPKVMDQRGSFSVESAAHHGQIFSHWRMRKKLLDQPIAITVRLGEQQNSGCKSINAVHDKGALSFWF